MSLFRTMVLSWELLSVDVSSTAGTRFFRECHVFFPLVIVAYEKNTGLSWHVVTIRFDIVISISQCHSVKRNPQRKHNLPTVCIYSSWSKPPLLRPKPHLKLHRAETPHSSQQIILSLQPANIPSFLIPILLLEKIPLALLPPIPREENFDLGFPIRIDRQTMMHPDTHDISAAESIDKVQPSVRIVDVPAPIVAVHAQRTAVPAREAPARVRRREEPYGDSGVAFGAGNIGAHGFDFELKVRRPGFLGQHRVVLQGGEKWDVGEEDCVLTSGVCADSRAAQACGVQSGVFGGGWRGQAHVTVGYASEGLLVVLARLPERVCGDPGVAARGVVEVCVCGWGNVLFEGWRWGEEAAVWDCHPRVVGWWCGLA
jgi:hypothetical protein